MNLVLDNAEFALLLSSLRIDARPYLAFGPLTGLGAAELQTRILAARNALIERGLAQVEARRGLAPNAQVSRLLKRVTQSPAGFELMSNSREEARRIQFNVDADGIVIHRMFERGAHVISEASPAEGLVDLIMAATQLQEVPANGDGAAYNIQHELIQALASTGASEPQLRAQLATAQMTPVTADAFLRAGLRPQQQGVLTAISRAGDRVRASAISWFADAATCWVMVNPGQEGGSATLVNARDGDMRSAVAGMVSGAL
jgi:hypothetical protein